MSSIDQVIARARQGEVAFAERKQFKLARRRAIEKLRRFALADPYFYVLEIIQAAVANGAEGIDIACDAGEVLISWIGGHTREDELAQLFEFLFASKERVDLAHVRSLALGVNALLLFEPDQVVIESGNGQPGGTARMVVRAGADQVEVGRAEGVFTGTYVRASKLDRAKVARETNRRGDDDGDLERRTIESRCLAAPVPIVFNSLSLFGWARQRVPNLYGYQKLTSFDEGDLYGSIGYQPKFGNETFQLLTHGVWVQSTPYELIPNQRFGGIVCFDRLRKTVDHSGFVRDDRFEELWVRLRPYAEALVSGKPVASSSISSAEGLVYTPAELRELLHEHPRVVIVAPEMAAAEGKGGGEGYGEDGDRRWRAGAIARLLDAELLWAKPEQVTSVRVLGDRNLLIWRPSLHDPHDFEFYGRDDLAPPPAPHLLPALELEVPTLDELVAELAEQIDPASFLITLARAGLLDGTATSGFANDRLARQLRVMLGETGELRATLYSPTEPGPAAAGLLVRVTASGRLLGERLLASAYPGRILDVDLPSAQPLAMKVSELVDLVAERIAERALPSLREQDQRALVGLGVGAVEAGSPAARLALQVLVRVTLTRLRSARPPRSGSGSGSAEHLQPGLSFSLLRPVGGFDPLTLPLLRTVAGTPITLRELALLSDATGGLVYGTIPEVPADLDGLDPARILALDAITEPLVIGLLGESGYVRIDARDELAGIDGVVVRDLALGLREYPDFPLLIEGQVELLTKRTPMGRQRLLASLVAQLRERTLGRADAPGEDPRIVEEHRRQALRHLQWLACREFARGESDLVERLGLLDLPLFTDLDGKVWPLRALAEALGQPEGLRVHYGHGLGQAELGSLSAAVQTGEGLGEGRPSSIAVSAFGYRLLAPLGRTRLAFDFDLDDAEALADPSTPATAFLVEERWSDDAGASVLGIPAQRLPEYRIQLRDQGRGAVAAVDELAQRYGIVGVIDVDVHDPTSISVVQGVIEVHASALLERAIAKLPEISADPEHYAAALRSLLGYVGEQLGLVAEPAGLVVQVATPLATRILGLPLFDLGGPTLVSGQRLLERFRRDFDRRLLAANDEPMRIGAIDWSTILAPSSPAIVREWLDTHLQPAAVALPASSSSPRSAPDTRSVPKPQPAGALAAWDPREPFDGEALAFNLEHWLAKLRPDIQHVTRVWLPPDELPAATLVDGTVSRAYINGEHPLAHRLLADPSPSNLAWLLLGVYAHLNLIAGDIHNGHEALFHLRVGQALVDGRLTVLTPPISSRSGVTGHSVH
jgi:hypothetical protein